MAISNRATRALGVAIRERRLALGARFTQEEIAHRARISVRQLQKLEAGLSNPKFNTLLAVARALRTNLQTLLDYADAPPRRR